MFLKRCSVALILLVLAGCGSSGNKSNPSDPFKSTESVAGSWEVTLPNVDGLQTTGYIEATLVQSGNSVTSQHVEYFQALEYPNNYEWCDASNNQSLTATVSGSKISGTVSTCMGVSTFTGDVSNGMIYGAWKRDAFGGSFSAVQVPPSIGKYAGNMTINGVLNYVTITISQDSSGTVLVTGTADQAGTILLSVTPVGRTILASGTVGGLQVRVFGIPIESQMFVCDQSGGFALGTLYKQ